MLACQYSFGSTIGAPVVFYIGSFIYALLEIRAQLGDNDTSHALAFGMWWMTIPHIAIVSGCLLAGNNPNTLEAIVPFPSGPSIRNSNPPGSQLGPQASTNGANAIASASSSTQEGWLRKRLPHFGPTYDAQYQPKWMIDRGRSKREWLFCLIEIHERRALGLTTEALAQLEDLRTRLAMVWGDWLTLAVSALLLFMVPCMFGFLVAFLTPQIGLSCRSFTVSMYATSQVGLLLLWLWNVTWRDEKWRRRRKPRGDQVYSNVVSPGVAASQPPARREAAQNQTAQTGPTANGAGPSRVERNDIGPGAETLRRQGVGEDAIQMVPMSAATPSPRSSVGPNSVTYTIERCPHRYRRPRSWNSCSSSYFPMLGPSCLRASSRERCRFWLKPNGLGPIIRALRCHEAGAVLYWGFMAVLLSLAVLSAIGGTVMQIVGVYRTCLCQINVSSWLSGRNSASLIISNNTSQDIRLAHQIWIRFGIAASVFLGLTAYISWWYQRRLRFRFSLLLGNDYLGVFNNQMRKPGTKRQSTEDSLTADENGAGASANYSASNGATNRVVNGIINGTSNFTAHGGVVDINGPQPRRKGEWGVSQL